MINDEVKTGETVSAVLRNEKTGKKTVIAPDKPTLRITITVTNLKTGKIIYTHEEDR